MLFSWWQWLVLGLILVILEMASSGGFYVIFFGVAAIAISILRAFDVAGPVWLQLLLFAGLSIASLLVFRNALLRWMKMDKPGADVDSLIDETAIPLDDIAAGAVGRAELRGTVWSARNSGSTVLVRGQRCRVVRVERLMIFLEAEGAR
jgi:membrane protein implicated in regulation of membrane protease activity